MNPITALLIGAGYGYLAGNPQARIQFFKNMQQIAGQGVDALNKMGGEQNASTTANDAVPRTE